MVYFEVDDANSPLPSVLPAPSSLFLLAAVGDQGALSVLQSGNQQGQPSLHVHPPTPAFFAAVRSGAVYE